MITIGQITHRNNTIDRKAKAFYDYFHYFLSKNEFVVLEEQASENHLTILEKMDFRLKETKIKKSSQKILRYLKDSPYLNTKDDLISRKRNCKSQINNIKTVLQKDLSKNENIELAKQGIKLAVEALNDKYDYQNTKYLDFCLDELIRYIGCEHELERHVDQIKYYTKLIVAEFLRRNFSPEELTGVNSLFSKLLSKEVKISNDGKNIYSKFPLPSTIKTVKETPDEYKCTIQKYLHNRTLKEQFKGILNYLENTRYSSIFIVKILNADCNDVNISFGTTRIVTENNLNINKNNWNEFQKKHFEEFTKTQNCIFFEKKLEYKSLHYAATEIMRDAEDTLSYLSYPNQLRGTVDRSEFLYLSNNKLGRSWVRNKLGINQNKKYELDRIKLDNVLYQELFELDKLYFRVFTSIKPEDKIFNAWRYIEVLFKDTNDEDRIKDFARLLLTDEITFQKESLENLIINIVINNQEVINCKIPDNKLDKVIKDRDNRIDIIKENIDYKFVNDLIDKYKNPIINYDSKFEFYKILINTLYEQRNYVVHQASICHISLEIFINQIQIVLKRVRNNLHKELQIRNDFGLINVLKKLLSDAEALID